MRRIYLERNESLYVFKNRLKNKIQKDLNKFNKVKQ